MPFVRIDDDGPLRTITLDRPDRLNALGPQLRDALAHAVADTADSDVRVVVLQGAGRVFSAGADLKESDAVPADATWQQRRRAAGRWQRLLDDIEELPQVTVASLHGAVVGGAALLATACDLRVAAADLAFTIPELHLGIPLTWGGIPRLVREVGLPRARELVLTGRTIGAEEALDWGLVHRVGDREDVTSAVVSELLAMPEAPLAMTKDAMRAYGRTLVSHDAAWADADLLSTSSPQPEARRAAVDYLDRLQQRSR